MKKHQLCLLFFLLSIILFGKTDSIKIAFRIDSIKTLIDASIIDSNQVKHYYFLSKLQRQKRAFSSAIKSLEVSEGLAKKADFKDILQDIYLELQDLYYLSGDMEGLAKHQQMVISHCKATKDSTFLAYSYNITGDYHVKMLGEYEVGLQYYDSAKVIYLKIKQLYGLTAIYNDIAGVYYRNLDYPKAAEILQEALKPWAADTSRRARISEATLLNNLGILYKISGDTAKAYDSYLQALAIDSLYKDYRRISHRLNSLALIEMQQGDYKTAHKRLVLAIYHIDDDLEYYNAYDIYNTMARLFSKIYRNSQKSGPNINDEASIELAAYAPDSIQYYYRKSFEITHQKGMVLQQARILNRLAMFYVGSENHKKAYELISQSILLYDSANALIENYEVYYDRAEIEANLGNFEPAYYGLKRYIEIDDSIMTQDQRISLAKKTTAFDYEKKMLILNQEKEIQKELDEKQQLIIWFGGAGICLLLLFIIFGYNRFRVTQKQHRIIGSQKKELYDKNTKIMSSINYAQNIQNAILPDSKEISDVFPDSLVLYIPKDVVSGDFYYINQVGNLKFIIVADCTGHGVPGAFMSFICNSLIKRIIEEDLPNNAGDFMNKLSELFESYLTNNNVELTDGLYISIAMINTQTNKMSFAGATSPVLFTSDSGQELKYLNNGLSNSLKPEQSLNNVDFYLINGDEHNLGFGEAKKEFTNHEVLLSKDSKIYLFTDGYIGQAGDSENKQNYLQNFIELLSNSNTKLLSEQQSILNKELVKWRGNKKQTDDICVIGVII